MVLGASCQASEVLVAVLAIWSLQQPMSIITDMWSMSSSFHTCILYLTSVWAACFCQAPSCVEGVDRAVGPGGRSFAVQQQHLLSSVCCVMVGCCSSQQPAVL